VFARHWLLKALGAVILMVPHLVGAPQPAVHSALAPEALQTQFKLASLLTNAAFWVALGWISAWLFRRSEASATHSGLNHAL
jgi:predicted cobalt transporter CbtA